MRRRTAARTATAGERKHRFGAHDRLVIDGQSFRVDKKVKDSHVLQPMTGEHVAETYRIVKTDADINLLMKSKRVRIDEGYYSRALSLIRIRADDSDLSDLPEDQLRTIAWKKEWCVRFFDASADVTAAWRPQRTVDDYGRFAEENKDRMDRWYFETFGERRRPGRRLPGEERKAFDWPSGATLKRWVIRFLDGDCKMGAFRPGYSNCGNRNQLNEEAAALVEVHVKTYASRRQPKMADICQDVELALEELNVGRTKEQRVHASANAVRRRIRKLSPIFVDAGRHGRDYAMRKYAGVGRGLQGTMLFERVEMDDWEVDLQTLMERSVHWASMPAETKKLVPRIRMTITAAVECYSRAVVGLSVTAGPPTTASAKSALRSVMSDKSALAAFGEAEAPWPMRFRPNYVATDGGPVFRGEFGDAARMSGVNRVIPEQDPRMRGTVESFFRRLKRVCRYFAGQTFSNVVQRGDYPSEELASITVGAFHKAVVNYVVDSYHMTPHSGLEGRTPYEVYRKACLHEGGEPPPPSDRQLAVAFGLPAKPRPITQHGVTVLGQSYNSVELSKLRGLIGNRSVRVVLDQENAGCVWVLVPHSQRGLIPGLTDDDTWIEVHHPALAGRLWIDLLLARKEVIKLAKEEQAAGRPFRLASHRKLLAMSDEACKDAGIPADVISAALFARLEEAVGRKTKAGLSEVGFSAEEVSDDDFGELVAAAAPRAGITDTTGAESVELGMQVRGRPFGGSMNDIGDDDE